MEICVDSVQSAINAVEGGADRLELCSNLLEGGTTPTVGMLKVVKSNVSVPVFVMIRPRGGDFLYTQDEFDIMVEDIERLKAAGADGFVFGILTKHGDVDVERCKILLGLSSPLPVTYHRAFDMVSDHNRALEDLMELGFDRILTSGLDSSALEGLPVIKELVECARGRIIILPGGGITVRNLERILIGSGAKEFHCSARSLIGSKMIHRNHNVSMGSTTQSEYEMKLTDTNKVKGLKTIASLYWHKE